MNSYEELDYKTHSYVECLDDECAECERYYIEELHPNFLCEGEGCLVCEESEEN